MAFFSTNSENNQLTAVKKEMNEIKERFYSFLEKLEQKTTEFTQAAIPELEEMNASDADEYKREYHRMKAAVLGQLQNIQQKAFDVKEEKVANFYLPGNSQEFDDLYYKFRSECYERYNRLDKLLSDSRQQIEATHTEDYEIQYQAIIDEYEATKNNFHCMQCGSPVPLTKIYFITTYLSCASCQTQNTFEPSSQAKQLEHLGRSLAEQRTAHLLKEIEAIPERLQNLHLQRHELTISLFREKNTAIISKKTAEINQLEQEEKKMATRATHSISKISSGHV